MEAGVSLSGRIFSLDQSEFDYAGKEVFREQDRSSGRSSDRVAGTEPGDAEQSRAEDPRWSYDNSRSDFVDRDLRVDRIAGNSSGDPVFPVRTCVPVSGGERCESHFPGTLATDSGCFAGCPDFESRTVEG